MKLKSGLFLMGAIFLVSCGDDVPKSTTTLNDAEMKAVLKKIESVSSDFKGDEGSTSNPPGTGTENGAIDETNTCSPSGNVTTTGKYGLDVKTVDTDFTGFADATSKYNDCTVSPSGAASDLILNGSLNTDVKTSVSTVSKYQTTSIKGSLNVKNVAAGDGICGVLFTVIAKLDQTTLNISVTGSVCGVAVTNNLL